MITAIIVAPPSSNKSKSEQEVLAENGGHVFFKVHLAHCKECQAEQARRELKDADSMGAVIATFLICLAVGFTLAAIYWDGGTVFGQRYRY